MCLVLIRRIFFGMEEHNMKISSFFQVTKLNRSFASAIVSKHTGSFCCGHVKVTDNG